MIKPRLGENECWRVSDNSMPYRITLGWDGEFNYGWSLGSGRVRWSTVFLTERDALEFTKKQRLAKLKNLTDEISIIDARIVNIAAEESRQSV